MLWNSILGVGLIKLYIRFPTLSLMYSQMQLFLFISLKLLHFHHMIESSIHSFSASLKTILTRQFKVCMLVILAILLPLPLLLLTCRPAEPQRPPSARLNPPPSDQLHFPPPSPLRAFPSTPGWHHHRGTHGPPHLLPITSPPKPSTKETPNGYEMERNNLGPWENISEWSRASSQSGRGVDLRVIIWCDLGSRRGGRGVAGTFREVFSGCVEKQSSAPLEREEIWGSFSGSQPTRVRGCPLLKLHICWAKNIRGHRILKE